MQKHKPPANERSSIPWITQIRHEDTFFQETDFSCGAVSTATSLRMLKQWLNKLCDQDILRPIELEPFYEQMPKELCFRFYENNQHTENFILPPPSPMNSPEESEPLVRSEKVFIEPSATLKHFFVRRFFYRTLVGQMEHEFASFLLFQELLQRVSHWPRQSTHGRVLSTILEQVSQMTKDMLTSRHKLIEHPEAYQSMYVRAYEEFPTFIQSLVFTATLHTGDPLSLFCELEKKQLNEYIFSSQLKRLLGMEKQSYKYIEQDVLLNKSSSTHQKKYYTLKEAFEEEGENLASFVDDHIYDTKILLWCSWTISPFLAPDINHFLEKIIQRKKIVRVYTDLPVECTEAIQYYLNLDLPSGNKKGHHLPSRKRLFQPTFHPKEITCPDTLLREQVECLYPIFIPDYAKETLPYIVFFEKLRNLGVDPSLVECIGFDGDDLMLKRPIEKENTLQFSIDSVWEEKISSSLSLAESISSDELILFFYFLKPVYFLPPHLQGHPQITRMLHVDGFTGFGPEQPINSLARYSQHAGKTAPSFAFTNIAQSPLAEEKIVFYPSPTSSPHPIEDKMFNAFNLYDALLYSGMKGGGSGPNQYEPVQPRRDYSFSY